MSSVVEVKPCHLVETGVSNDEEEQKKTLQELAIDREETIVITHYVNPELFCYVNIKQLEAIGSLIYQKEVQLLQHCDRNNRLETYALNQKVIVRYWPVKLHKLLRGSVIVVGSQNDDYLVWAVDYGFSIRCRAKDMWLLPRELSQTLLKIGCGGVAGVAPLVGAEWSQLAVSLLDKQLEEALVLSYNIKQSYEKRTFGQLLIKPQQRKEPLLDAATFLLDNQCARPVDSWLGNSNYLGFFDFSLAKPNYKNSMSCKRVEQIIHLVGIYSRTPPMLESSERVQSAAEKMFKNDSYTRSGNSDRPSGQPEKLDVLLLGRNKFTLSNVANSFALVNGDTAISEQGVFTPFTGRGSRKSSSSSSGTSTSNSSANSFDTVVEQTKYAKRNSRSILDFYNRPLVPGALVSAKTNLNSKIYMKPERSQQQREKNTVQELLLNVEPKSIPKIQDELQQQHLPLANKLVNQDIKKHKNEHQPIQRYQAESENHKAQDEVKNKRQEYFFLNQKPNINHIYNKHSLVPAKAYLPTEASFNAQEWVLAHSIVPLLPLESLFCREVDYVMRKMDFQTSLPTQIYVRAHLMRGNSLVLVDRINSGRSWSYLPAICSLVIQDMSRIPSNVVPAFGPWAVIIADTVEHANVLSHMSLKLMENYRTQIPKLVNTHKFSMHEVNLMLLNSCGILITTLTHFLQLMRHDLQLIRFQRLKYFIMDDYDRMLAVVPDLLQDLLQQLQRLSLPRMQLVVIAQQWHSLVFKDLIKRFGRNPLLLFGDFLEAAIYGNLKLDFTVQQANKKIQHLLDYLAKHLFSKKRTIIFCQNIYELDILKSALTEAGYKWIGLAQASNQKKHQLLLMDAGQRTPVKIRNFDLIVHFSLPNSWLKFCNRFSAVSDNIYNCLISGEQKQQDIPSSYIMLDENNGYEFARLIQFLDAHKIQLGEDILKLNPGCRQVLEKNRAYCQKMLESGACAQFNCRMRHYVLDRDFHWDSRYLWQTGMMIRCKLMMVYSPVHVAVMPEIYKTSGSDSWQGASHLSKLRILSTALNLHLSHEQHRRAIQKFQISQICVLYIDKQYQRVRVKDLSDNRSITVQLMDEGTHLLKVKPAELLECPRRFQTEPPLCLDVRLCGLRPPIPEGDWLSLTTQWVKKNLNCFKEQQQLQLCVELVLLGTVYVKEITVVEECPSMKTSVKTFQLQQELVQRKFAKQDQSLEKLRKILEEQERVGLQKMLMEKSLEECTGESLDCTLQKKTNKSEKEYGEQELHLETLRKDSWISKFLKASSNYFFKQENQEHEKEPEQKEKLIENNEEETLKPETVVQLEPELDSVSSFIEMMLQDLNNNDDVTVKEGAQQILKEILGEDRSDMVTSAKTPTRSKPQMKQNPRSSALYFGNISGGVVRPNVKWHQTMMHIYLIIEQQEQEYELKVQGNVLAYEAATAIPPKRFIANLLGEVSLLSHQQHGYHLHVKLAKRGLHMYWPTLLSSLYAQQHSSWLSYDMERGRLPTHDLARVNWLRYMRKERKQQEEDDNSCNSTDVENDCDCDDY